MTKRKRTTSTDGSDGSGAENNTALPQTREPLGSKWYLTINNWKPEDWDQLDQIFKDRTDVIDHAAMGKEVGENGTPHLQIYIAFTKRTRPRESKIFEGIGNNPHWGDKFGKPCKAKMPPVVGINYCSKDGDFVLYRCRKPRELNLIEPRGWQCQVVDIVKSEPDDRTVHWLYEPDGGSGKTSLCKYLAVEHDALILGGKAADIRHAIMEHKHKHGNTPELIVSTITRSQEKRVSYEGLENIKDMCFYSGKYEGGMVLGPCPHLIVFANFRPETSALSADRWCIMRITQEKLIREDVFDEL